MERTLILVKVDGVQRRLVGKILSRFEAKGLKIAGLKFRQFARQLIEQHYGEHRDKPFFSDVVGFMTSGPVCAIVLQGPEVISVCRKLIGQTHRQKPIRERSGAIWAFPGSSISFTVRTRLSPLNARSLSGSKRTNSSTTLSAMSSGWATEISFEGEAMIFGASELKAVLDECRGALAGARLKNIYDEGDRGWIFKLYSHGQTRFLHLSAQPRFCRLHLQPARSSAAAAPGDFCRALRSHLQGALLEDIRQVGGDRIAELSFTAATGRLLLVQEMFGARPEILLLDDERKIICSLSLVAGARSRRERGGIYEFPAAPADASAPGVSQWLQEGAIPWP